MADWRELYPFPSQFIKLAGGVKMHYVETGAGNDNASANRPTVLCVHGNPTWSFTFRRVLAELSSDVRVIAVDHVGCGLSDKPQQYRYTLEQHIANLVQLIVQLDLRRVTLLVHDWGGAIGLGAGLRVLERIEGAVILNTAAFPPPYVPLRIAACRIPIIGNWAMRQLNLFARAALKMTLHRLPKLDDKVAAGLLAPYSNWANRVAIAKFVQDIPRSSAAPTWQLLADIERQLALYRDRPVKLVWGMHDWCFRPECLYRFQQLLPNAKTHELSDVGHYVMEEAAEEVLEAIRSQLAVGGRQREISRPDA
jgi:cis-3-alkyl-4-acyloxetan-2-one decarboxylase